MFALRSAKTLPDVFGHGELAQFSQVGCHQQAHQHKAARPAQNVGQTVETHQVNGAGQAQKAGCAHPVGGSGHAVEQGRHFPVGYIIGVNVGGAAHQSDDGIQHNGKANKAIHQPCVGRTGFLQGAHQQHSHTEYERDQQIESGQLA